MNEKIIATYDNEAGNGLVDIEIIKDNVSNKKTIQFDDYIDALKDYSGTLEANHWSRVTKDIVAIGIGSNSMSIRFIVAPSDVFLSFKNKPVIWKLPHLLIECSTKGDLKFWALKTKSCTENTRVYDLNLPHHYRGGIVCYGSFAKRKVTVEEMVAYAFEYLQTTATHQITKNLIPQANNTFKYKIFEKDFFRKVNEL